MEEVGWSSIKGFTVSTDRIGADEFSGVSSHGWTPERLPQQGRGSISLRMAGQFGGCPHWSTRDLAGGGMKTRSLRHTGGTE